jgi:rare lipoprotein A
MRIPPLSTPNIMRSAPLLPLAACLLLAGCFGAPKAPPPSYQVRDGAEASLPGGYKLGKPYQIDGVWYYPQADYSYDETGIASSYRPDYRGKFTANGEVFSQDEVAAAHRTLPLPSLVRVSNLDNGRSILVRLNDRGPYAHGRILDLSRRAAEMLGMEPQGTARVRVQIMGDESRMLAFQSKGYEAPPLEAAPRPEVQTETLAAPPGRAAPARSRPGKPVPAAPPPPVETASLDLPVLATQQVVQGPPRSTELFIQAGALSRFDNANRMSAALSPLGKAVVSQIQVKGGGSQFRVRLGPLPSLADADAMLERVIAAGYPDARLVVE